MSDSYTFRQARRDAQHAEAYRDWVRTLSAAKREKLRRLGIDQPDTSYHGTGMSDRDMADTALASEAPDIIAQIEPEDPPATHEPAGTEALWDALRRMLGELLNQKNAKLTLECFAVVSGASFLGDSMTDIARRHGITRAAVSKRCVDIATQLNLPPSRSMRAKTARDIYRSAQIKSNQTTNQ